MTTGGGASGTFVVLITGELFGVVESCWAIATSGIVGLCKSSEGSDPGGNNRLI